MSLYVDTGVKSKISFQIRYRVFSTMNFIITRKFVWVFELTSSGFGIANFSVQRGSLQRGAIVA